LEDLRAIQQLLEIPEDLVGEVDIHQILQEQETLHQHHHHKEILGDLQVLIQAVVVVVVAQVLQGQMDHHHIQEALVV
jgi:hypothetical protein